MAEKTELQKVRDAAGARARRRAETIAAEITKAQNVGGNTVIESLEKMAMTLAKLLAEEHLRANAADLDAATVAFEKSISFEPGTIITAPAPGVTTMSFYGLTPDEKTALRKAFGYRIADSNDLALFPDAYQRVSKARMQVEWPAWGRVTAAIVGRDGQVEGVTLNKAAREKAERTNFLALVEKAFRQDGNAATVVLR